MPFIAVCLNVSIDRYLIQTYSNRLYLKWLLSYLQDEYKDQIDLHPKKKSKGDEAAGDFSERSARRVAAAAGARAGELQGTVFLLCFHGLSI
eukprot:SAG22_NODE_15909_length_337_cov_0.861345_1_plen_92_part_00